MEEWLTPNGLMVIFAFVVGVALPFVAKVLRLAGKPEIAASVESLTQRAEAAESGLASVVQGVQEGKNLLSPGAVKTLTAALRKRNVANGVEHLVEPIVHGMRTGVAPLEAVRAETRKLSRLEG